VAPADPTTGLILIAAFIAIHCAANKYNWYQNFPYVDIVTHFLGGLILGMFVKELVLGLGLVFLWELFEALLVKESRDKFKESPMNKLRDVLIGLAGFLIGVDFLVFVL